MQKLLPRLAKGTRFDTADLARSVETAAEATVLPLFRKHRAEDRVLHALPTDRKGQRCNRRQTALTAAASRVEAFLSARVGDAGIVRHAGLRLTLHRRLA